MISLRRDRCVPGAKSGAWSGVLQGPLYGRLTRPPMSHLRAGFLPSIRLDPAASTPLRRQLYEWFRRAIADGRLKSGQRVPSSRGLAEELKVSRLTVVSAYEQLEAEGYLQTFRGAGTCIAASIPELLRRGGARDGQGRKESPRYPADCEARETAPEHARGTATGDRRSLSGELACSRSFPAPRVVAPDIAACAQRFHQGHGLRGSDGRA